MDVHPLTPDRWDDFVDLFERRGPRGGMGIAGNGCWCMWWRERTGDRERNRRAMRGLVRDGREPGLLAYDGGTAVGWLSLGPREDFGQLVRSRTYAPPELETGIWAIVCFYVHPTDRHRGVNPALLEAAVGYADARGARALEAYPHARGDFMGAPELFQRFGFERIRTAGPRVVMRRVFSGRAPRARARGRAAG